MQFVAVKTVLGTIRGRNAIYLDQMLHLPAPSRLKFTGEISLRLCNEYKGDFYWVRYDMEFSDVPEFKCWTLDSYPSEKSLTSSLDLVEGSLWPEQYKNRRLRHYVLATYDYVYELLADKLEIALGEMRHK